MYNPTSNYRLEGVMITAWGRDISLQMAGFGLSNLMAVSGVDLGPDI
jgi:hypothetical protein